MNYNPAGYQSTYGAGGGMNLSGLFPVQIGADTSGLFAMSPYGLAVVRPDGRAVVHREGSLLDVSAFLLPGFSPGAFRIPVPEIEPGELVITSDNPRSLLYVLERTETGLRGLDPFTGNVVRYIAPRSPFFNFFVRVQSVFGLLFAESREFEEGLEAVEDDREERGLLDRLLPLLLLSSQYQSSGTSFLTWMLLMQTLGRRH